MPARHPRPEATNPHQRHALVVSSIASTALWIAARLRGYRSGLLLQATPGDPQYQPWSRVSDIFTMNNTFTTLSSYSGVLVFGLLSMIVTPMLDLFAEGAIHATVASLGGIEAFALQVPYFIFEGLGLVVATWAGLLSVTALILIDRFHGEAPSAAISRYISTMRQTIPCMSTSMTLLLIGTIFEIQGDIPR